MIRETAVALQDIEFTETFPTSHEFTWPSQHVFIRIATDDHVGYGEGSALTWFTGETTATMGTVVSERFFPIVKGRSVDDAVRAFREYVGESPSHPGAAVAVEMALLDLKARQSDIPLSDLIGPIRYRDIVDCVWVSGALPAEEVAAKVRSAYEEGFRTFKIKADGAVSTDLKRINAVIGELVDLASSDEVTVRVDANTGWNDYETARRAVEAIEYPSYLEYVEQPVRPDGVEDLRRLREVTGIPIFADESAHSLSDVRRLTAEPRAISGICLKLAKTGSLLDVVTMGRIAANCGLPVTPVSAFDTSLGVAAHLHYTSVLPGISAGLEAVSGLLDENPVDDPIDIEPTMAVPEGPGIGVELADDLFE